MSNGHLVLTRKPNETLCFSVKDSDGSATDFTLSIDQVNGTQVRLSVNAPANVQVLREELLEQITGSAPTSVNAAHGELLDD